MRFIHTSDWHLGRSLGTFGLLGDQERFVDWFLDLCVEAGAELAVVAGDVYDRSNPPAEAIALFNSAVTRLHDAGIELLVVAGNHDSPERVALYGEVTAGHGVILRGGYHQLGSVLVRNFVDGPLAIAPIPFLDPRLIPAGASLFPHQEAPFTHHGVVARAATAAAQAVPAGMRSLAVAHGFVAGGRGSDSEKLLVGSVGGADHVGAACFAPFSYTALGHLHRPQRVQNSATIRYSGSPLPYSFSEVEAKQVLVVDMDTTGTCSVEPVEVPVGRRVRTIRGRFDELIGAEVDDHHFIRVELTDPSPIRDAKRRLQVRFPHLVELAMVGPAPSRLPAPAGHDQRDRTTLADRVAAFLLTVAGDEASTEDFDAIVEALAAAGADPGDAGTARGTLAAGEDAEVAA